MSCTAANSDGHKGQVSNGLDERCAGPLQMSKGEEIWEAEKILGEEKLWEEDERQLLEHLEKMRREAEESGDQDAFCKRVIQIRETKQVLEHVRQYYEVDKPELERIQQECKRDLEELKEELKRAEQGIERLERLEQERDARQRNARAEAGERQLWRWLAWIRF